MKISVGWHEWNFLIKFIVSSRIYILYLNNLKNFEIRFDLSFICYFSNYFNDYVISKYKESRAVYFIWYY